MRFRQRLAPSGGRFGRNAHRDGRPVPLGEDQRGGAFRDLADFCARVDPAKLNKRVLDALILSGSLDALGANRASLAAQLPEALRAAEQRARDDDAGQFGLFGGGGNTAAPAQTVAPVEVPEWPIAQRLAGERDTLGHYLSGHPADAWRELFAQITSCAIGEIDKHYKPPREGRLRFSELPQFTLAGSVVGLRKQGDSRAFVTVEDGSGKFEAVLYRETWIEYGPLLTRDAMLVFEGGLSVDDFTGGYQLRVNSVSTIDAACEKRARLLRVKLNGIDGDFVAHLHRALAGHRGGHTPVRLSYRNANASVDVELGNAWRVRASHALADTLQNLDGVISAEIVFN